MNNKIRRYIIIFTGILIFWLAGIPYLFSLAVPVLCENLSFNSSYNVVIDKPSLSMNIIPIAKIHANSITISSKDKTERFYIDSLNIKLRLLPLLSGKIHLDDISISDTNINCYYKKDTDLTLLWKKYFSQARFKCDNFDIGRYKISIITNKNTGYSILYAGNNLNYKKNSSYTNFNIESTLIVNNIKSLINIKLYLPQNNKNTLIKVELKNFNIDFVQELLNNYLPADLHKITGNINLVIDNKLLDIELNNCAYLTKDKAKSIIFPKKLKIVSSDFIFDKKQILLDNTHITAPNINTVISGKISNYMSKAIPEYLFNIQINNSKIEDFINMLPPFKTEDMDVYKLKKYKFFGDVIGLLTIKGDNAEPSVNGSIYINNGILTEPIPNAKGATVKLDFKGKYLNFDVFVPAGGSEKVWVKGGVELYNVKYSDMRVWSTPKVNLETAQIKVNPIHEILNFVVGPVPIMDIKGHGNIDITIKGNRKSPHIWGTLNLFDVSTHFLEMPDLILNNADTILTFNDENATFNLKKGTVNNRPVNIDGTCNLSGLFDFDVKNNNQSSQYLYHALQTSTIIDEVKNMLPQLDNLSGITNLNLKVYGNIKDIEKIHFKENFYTKGSIELINNTISSQGIHLNNTNGLIKFDNTNLDLDIKSSIGDSPLTFKGSIKDNIADADLYIPNLNLHNVISKNQLNKDLTNIFIELKGKYKGTIDKIQYDKIDFSAKILSVKRNNKLKLSNGIITLKNGNLNIKNLNGNFENTNSSFSIIINANNIINRPNFNGKIILKDFELNILNWINDNSLLPHNIKELINTVRFEKGKVNVNASIVNNNIYASTDIGGITFTYLPLNLPIKVVNGSIYIRKNYFGINKINIIADNMPILFDGGIDNIFSKKDFNISINSKPKQEFIDKYFNNNRIYPLKVKGDILCWLKLKGTLTDFNVESEAHLAKGAVVYYLGATVGDLENDIVLNLNMNILKHTLINIKEFSYDKIIDSQGKLKTRMNMLKSYGELNLLPNDIEFRNLHVKTSNPTDARIFNILFRKPNIKQGQFTSNLKFNGTLSNPKLLGSFHIVETNIPFLDITMKNLSLIFRDKTIELSSKGEVLGNDLIFKGTLKNKLSTPYYVENAELNTKILDLNYIIERLKSVQVDESSALDTFTNFNIKNTIIKNLKLTANEIRLRNLVAENIYANISMSEKNIFNLDNFKLKISDGFINGEFSYNLNNSVIGLNLKAKNINANDLAVALFDLKNQIDGNLTGSVKLSCIGSDFNKCMETIDGNTTFSVKNGRIPKLGSLEYLLKAGNLVKGGLTSLSLNNVVDILTPLKTGEFTDIYGEMNIQNGIANSVEIASKGKDLSLFITGKYNFATSIAEMEVLGLLSKKITTMLGPVGNISLNTLFNTIPGIDLSKDSKFIEKINKIPGIELNEKTFRKFIAIINGDINSSNYVTSFKWIN